MNRFITFDIKKQKKKYRLRTFALLIPFIQFSLVMALLYYININFGNAFSRRVIMWLVAGGIAAVLFIIIFYIFLCHHLIDAHKKNTFIDICGDTLIVSIHSQTVLHRFKKVYYKNLYVVRLTELEKPVFTKGRITLKGKVQSYLDKSDRLRYSPSNVGILFDNWWYNYNYKSLDSITFHDYFVNTPNMLRFVSRASLYEKRKIQKKREFHQKMLDLASNAKRSQKRLRTEIFKNK